MLKFQKIGISKALSILLAVAMVLTVPIGATQAYAAGEGTTYSVGTAADLKNALTSDLLKSGDTIKLTGSINYEEGVIIDNIMITFDVGPYTLNITHPDTSGLGCGLEVKNNGTVTLLYTTGELNVFGHYYGVRAIDSSAVTVTNATATGAYGYGAFAVDNAEITVSGDVEAVKNGSDGVVAWQSSNIMVMGNVTGNTLAAKTESSGTVYIEGDATSTGTGSSDVGVFASSNGKITVDGVINVVKPENYVRVDGVNFTIDGKMPSTTKAGYHTYMHLSNTGPDDSVVWVASKACAIGDIQYATLDKALAKVNDGETIILLQSITHNDPVVINGKSITFALGDFNLTIDTSAISNSTGLQVIGDGKVDCTGSGKFNVVGSDDGVRASGGSELHISGNVTARQYAVIAGSASGAGIPKVTVDGDVTVTGQGVNAWSEVEAVSVGGYATITIGGNVTANRTDEMQIVTAVYSNASTIVVGKNVTTQGSGVNAQNGGKVTIEGVLHYNPTGSGDQAYIKVGDPIVNKTAGDFEPTSIKPEYKEYKNGDNVVWVKEAPAICTIGAQKFTSLDAAIASVPAGGTATITLLQSITHTKHITVEKKTINIDLMDYDILLDTSTDGSYSPALMVIDGGKVNLIGSGTGEFNIKSYKTAISAMGINSRATVHNVVASDGNGVNMIGSGDYLDSSSTVTVLGSITVGNGNGVSVNAKNGKVVVNGNITAGRVGVDVASNPGTQVTVNGDIIVDGDSSIAGIWAYGATTVAVTGNVTVRGTNCVGVHASGSTIKVDGNVVSSGKGAHSDTNGKVEITGSLTAGTPFITVGATEMTAEEGVEIPGFLEYKEGISVVRIGSVGTPTPTPTRPGSSGGSKGVGISGLGMPEGTPGKAFEHKFSASGGSSPYKFKVSNGTLPKGLSLSEDGILSGIPLLPGSYTFTITVTDKNDKTESRELTSIIKLGADQKKVALTVGSLEALIGDEPYTLDVNPFIDINSERTMVGVRFISEALGAKVQWLQDSRQVIITDGDKEIILTIGSKNVLMNGQNIIIDSEARLLPPGRTFVPLRFVSEYLGATVDYDEKTMKVTIIR